LDLLVLIDHRGKDSYELEQAGAEVVVSDAAVLIT
jgi:molybdopterin-guanine dinucleotide biosynthesis protein